MMEREIEEIKQPHTACGPCHTPSPSPSQRLHACLSGGPTGRRSLREWTQGGQWEPGTPPAASLRWPTLLHLGPRVGVERGWLAGSQGVAAVSTGSGHLWGGWALINQAG